MPTPLLHLPHAPIHQNVDCALSEEIELLSESTGSFDLVEVTSPAVPTPRYPDIYQWPQMHWLA